MGKGVLTFLIIVLGAALTFVVVSFVHLYQDKECEVKAYCLQAYRSTDIFGNTKEVIFRECPFTMCKERKKDTFWQSLGL